MAVDLCVAARSKIDLRESAYLVTRAAIIEVLIEPVKEMIWAEKRKLSF